MIADLVKQKKCSVERAISYFISEGLVQELSKMVKLSDEKTKEMCEQLGIQTEDNDIYFNKFNIMFDNQETHNEFRHYLKIDNENTGEPERTSLVFELKIPQTNINIWAYSLDKNPLLNNMLG